MLYLSSLLFLIFSVIMSCQTINHQNNRLPFRDYLHAPLHVQEFYKLQHKNQTYDFALGQHSEMQQIFSLIQKNSKKNLYDLEKQGKIRRLSVWESVLELDKLLDESDPDFSLPNSIHALQTAEEIRKNLPRIARSLHKEEAELDWLMLVGLLHDIGKLDALLRKTPQWAVVGDTFPVGVQFSVKNIFFDYFKDNPDYKNPNLNSEFGVYKKAVGLDNIVMSWGHDEYAFQVLKNQSKLPEEALFIIRFHSFYPLHKEGAYQELLAPHDFERIKWVQAFSPYDLYSKSEQNLSREELKPYYQALINKYFPPSQGASAFKITWPILSALE